MNILLPRLISAVTFLLLFIFFPQIIFAQGAGADLTVTNLQLTDVNGTVKTNFALNERIYIRVTIKNIGIQTTLATGDNRIYHTYYQNQPNTIATCAVPSDPRNFYSHSGTNFTANSEYVYESFPGGIKEAQFPDVKSFTQSAIGTYAMRVYVDYDCRVPESNQNNNQRVLSYSVGSIAPTPTSIVVQTPTPVVALPTSTIIPGTTVPPIPGTSAPIALASDVLPPEGAWIIDPEVTRIGKNASRSGMLLDWTLRDYEWSFVREGESNPLLPFWQVIQRIVYALFLVVVMITAFILIITRGRSLSAKRFLPRFFMVVLLVTFSFSLVSFLYQIVDIFQGFFLRNPQGSIISSRDLLFIGFNYQDFQGLRRFGPEFDETAFTSLLFVKLTAFTYYVMAILLVIRKVILWFFLIISPVFPLLLLFYPVRNTAKIWVGEFFRWLLYAPLFAIFLSGLVRLWQTSLPLLFDFSGVSSGQVVYPTAVNILLGGPRQQVGIANSINLPDTFALYLVSIIMLWIVIIMPFILLQIFLDYLFAMNYKDSPVYKQMLGLINNRLVPPRGPKSPIIPVGPIAGAGRARNVPFARRFTTPTTTGLARTIPIGEAMRERSSIARPSRVTRTNRSEISNLTNLSIPTMRDIARYEKDSLSKNVTQQREVERTQQILNSIANPAQTNSITDRERYRSIKEKLLTQTQQGNQAASTILTAATTYANYLSQTTSATSSVAQNTQHVLQQIANPSTVTNTIEREKITQLRERLVSASERGVSYATTILNSLSSQSVSKVSQLQQALQSLANPTAVTVEKDKAMYQTLREKITTASRSGNQLAAMVKESLEKSSTTEEVTRIQEALVKGQQQGNPLATELLKTASNERVNQLDTQKLHTTLEEAKKQGDPLATLLLELLTKKQEGIQSVPQTAELKAKTGTFPVVNRLQQVSLDDYEAVKKMWQDNYQNLEVPQSSVGEQSRKNWITSDIADIEKTISLLTSTNAVDVEEGMKQVSDILPFLLIGGFSQTEIIAYLKAKLEAGKVILEDVDKQTEEDDTLLDVSRKAVQQQSQHLSATTAATYTSEVESPAAPVYKTVNNITNNTVTNEETNNNTTVLPPKNDIYTLANLSLPTMRDIVRYEQINLQPDAAVNAVKQTLESLAHPESLVGEDRQKYEAIKNTLIKESQAGNASAQALLTASTNIESKEPLNEIDTGDFIRTVQAVSDPLLVTDAKEREVFSSINSVLLAEEQKGNPFAHFFTEHAGGISHGQTETMQRLLQKIASPEKISVATERTNFTKLVERLMQERDSNDSFATTLLASAKPNVSADEADAAYTHILNAVANNHPMATFITTNVLQPSTEIVKELKSFHTEIIRERDKKNPLAIALMQVLNKKQAKISSPSLRLPRENRLQQVSLDDYEAVKKMWYEIYLNSDVPTKNNKEQTREEWIQSDLVEIAQVTNMLSSANAEDETKGMEMVKDLLPFLLIGGFSKDEVLGYLKAKAEAGKMALETLKARVEGEETKVYVDAAKKEQGQSMTQAAENDQSQKD